MTHIDNVLTCIVSVYLVGDEKTTIKTDLRSRKVCFLIVSRWMVITLQTHQIYSYAFMRIFSTGTYCDNHQHLYFIQEGILLGPE